MAEIKISEISRVYGHASLSIWLKDKTAESVNIRLTQPRRNFQNLALGRRYEEVPYLMSRICGSCSFSHHLASTMAIERALGCEEKSNPARELSIIAEIIHNHAFHLYWQVIPDYTGHSSLLELLPKNQKLVQGAILLRQTAKRIKTIIAGRPMHPLGHGIGTSVQISTKELALVKQAILDAIEPAKQTAEYIASLETEFFARKAEYMCVAGADYPCMTGNLISTSGMDIPQEGCLGAAEYKTLMQQKPPVVGALARMNNRHVALSPLARKAVKASRVIFPNYNPLMNNFAQSVEVIHLLETGLKALERIEKTDDSQPRKTEGVGTAAVESSKGTIVHHYVIKDGIVKDAKVITSDEHNIRNFEQDALKLAPRFLKSRREEIVLELGKLLRAYDLCFNCASH